LLSFLSCISSLIAPSPPGMDQHFLPRTHLGEGQLLQIALHPPAFVQGPVDGRAIFSMLATPGGRTGTSRFSYNLGLSNSLFGGPFLAPGKSSTWAWNRLSTPQQTPAPQLLSDGRMGVCSALFALVDGLKRSSTPPDVRFGSDLFYCLGPQGQRKHKSAPWFWLAEAWRCPNLARDSTT